MSASRSDIRKTPLDGRLLVMFSTDSKDEPRFQINDGPKTQQIFGIDVNDLQPGAGGRRSIRRRRVTRSKACASFPPATTESRH